MFVFDHDRALFGEHATDAVKRLNSLTERLGVSGGEVSRGNRHFLLRTINTTKDFPEWLSAIAETPDRFLREVCHEVEGFGITVEEADAAYNFLRFRKTRIAELIRNHKDQFKAVTQWGIF